MIWGNRGVFRVRAHLVAVAALACALIALAAVPALASAAAIEVDSLGDTPQKEPSAICDTGAPAGENCTLRAAIQAANFDPGPSVVEFSTSIFTGGQQIEPATALPAIVHPLTMSGQPVSYSGYSGPSVGVTAPAGVAGLTVEADGVTIERMAFGGGKAGVEVLDESTGFVAKGDWFGLNVIGTAGSIQKAGIVLGPKSDAATIGDGTESGRNVFTNSASGIYVEGASQAKVSGNYIGVRPKGNTTGGLTRGVRIVDTSTSAAEENEIGGIRAGAPGSTDCGGACNVIVAAGVGIDLSGETSANLGSASGPTTISGNYVGLASDGTSLPFLNGEVGVLAARPSRGSASPSAADVTIGGPVSGEGNVIDNGLVGVATEAADGLVVERNLLGWLPASASAGSSPQSLGLSLLDEGVTEAPEVSANELHLDHGVVGVLAVGPGADVAGNKIFGGETGILTTEADSGKGSLISENLIEDPDRDGVLIENDANMVTGNTILRAGLDGVILDREEAPDPWPTGNRIGGDAAALENLIEDSVESAISVGGEPSTTNEVLGNYGLGNGGPFILLREHSAGHPPNGEIKPPALEAVFESSASGTAKPGAKVRLFAKPSTDPGSLGRMIGTALADASGHWTATFGAKQAVGALVAATQTTAAGTPSGATSEVSAPKAAVADPAKPEEPTGGGSGGGTAGGSTGTGSTGGPSSPAPAPTLPAMVKAVPRVKITRGPKKTSEATTAKFRFKAEPVAGASFECSLDGSKWARCRSPKTYRGLDPGRHTFRVRAVASGRTGPATKYQFTVDP